jgi:undecaprenyl pyrophosphate synthase
MKLEHHDHNLLDREKDEKEYEELLLFVSTWKQEIANAINEIADLCSVYGFEIDENDIKEIFAEALEMR